VLAPRLPPIEDVVRDGSTGLLFNPLNPQDCARQLLRLVTTEDLRHALADAAFSTLTTEYTWSNTAARIMAAAEAS
jgi:glycosyltransferase involved in cell wall biosynthesis